jgi:hypothetical protein
MVSGSRCSPPYRTVNVLIAKAVTAIAHPADLLAPGTNSRQPSKTRWAVQRVEDGRVIKRTEVEQRVLAALQRRFFTKQRLEEWTRLYVAERNGLRPERQAKQADAPRQLASINARSKQILELLLKRVPRRGVEAGASADRAATYRTRGRDRRGQS